ncbi:hypothetical protein V7S43_000326 [Phytophthora oleae]|uniref:Uncharacterized protein n=1 Tax=Phytophthora oleae TaxID=2107226 RepID=A0ABD3G5D2_9STRA
MKVYEWRGQSSPSDLWEHCPRSRHEHRGRVPYAKHPSSTVSFIGTKGATVSMQTRVYGNINVDSLTGVLVTLNPANGESNLYGEALLNTQCKDVVAGIRTPSRSWQRMPAVYKQLDETVHTLDTRFLHPTVHAANA